MLSALRCRTRRDACQPQAIPCSAELEPNPHHCLHASVPPCICSQHTSTTKMTTCPSTDAQLLLADVLSNTSDDLGRVDLGVGVDASSATGTAGASEAKIRRASRVAQDAANEVATAMFRRRAGGPHPSGLPPVADYPTVEEIVIGQVAVAAAIGEKGSEERAQASKLAALGMIAKEEALGHWLCDRFNGAFPSSKKAHSIGRTAGDRLPSKKEKAKWKEKAWQARKAAEQRGADGDTVAAAGQQAVATARTAF